MRSDPLLPPYPKVFRLNHFVNRRDVSELSRICENHSFLQFVMDLRLRPLRLNYCHGVVDHYHIGWGRVHARVHKE
jgi:hypothetical protein